MPLSQSNNQDSAGDVVVRIEGATTAGAPTYPVNSDANGNLYTNDTVESSISSGSITVGTTPVIARVGSSNLANRKMLMISPSTSTVYLGSSSTTCCIPIYPGQVVSFAFSANVSPYLLGTVSSTVNIFEGA